LFITAIMVSSGVTNAVVGGVAGALVAGGMGWALFAAGLRLSLPHFFSITRAILLLVAAGLVGHAVHEFTEVGWIPALLSPVWDLGIFLPETSGVGLVLKALFGYHADLSLAEVVAYEAFASLLGVRLRRRPIGSAPSPPEAPA
jgi:high-affinity iron transporter